jgi:hypothetical protein
MALLWSFAFGGAAVYKTSAPPEQRTERAGSVMRKDL